ncbi:hypothetical protein C8R45DRAFT_1096451 [Mycena sanguinolenta]|nr:hypothetical protein C8R45DRAFT_1096451 [Mycena sanguinolenta]
MGPVIAIPPQRQDGAAPCVSSVSERQGVQEGKAAHPEEFLAASPSFDEFEPGSSPSACAFLSLRFIPNSFVPVFLFDSSRQRGFIRCLVVDAIFASVTSRRTKDARALLAVPCIRRLSSPLLPPFAFIFFFHFGEIGEGGQRSPILPALESPPFTQCIVLENDGEERAVVAGCGGGCLGRACPDLEGSRAGLDLWMVGEERVISLQHGQSVRRVWAVIGVKTLGGGRAPPPF